MFSENTYNALAIRVVYPLKTVFGLKPLTLGKG